MQNDTRHNMHYKACNGYGGEYGVIILARYSSRYAPEVLYGTFGRVSFWRELSWRIFQRVQFLLETYG